MAITLGHLRIQCVLLIFRDAKKIQNVFKQISDGCACSLLCLISMKLQGRWACAEDREDSVVVENNKKVQMY